jgi:catechol 2,3-dioxygenase
MKVDSLGHVVVKVKDQKRSEDFYNGVLGIPICARNEQPPMTFFSVGNHHDFAVMVIGDQAEDANKNAVGLAHVAFKIGHDMSELAEAKEHLEKAGIRSMPIDHEVTKSLYFADPDGNEVELYIDASDAWKAEPQRVAQASPLEL